MTAGRKYSRNSPDIGKIRFGVPVDIATAKQRLTISVGRSTLGHRRERCSYRIGRSHSRVRLLLLLSLSLPFGSLKEIKELRIKNFEIWGNEVPNRQKKDSVGLENELNSFLVLFSFELLYRSIRLFANIQYQMATQGQVHVKKIY